MNIIDTSSQILTVCCLLLGGIIYSFFALFIRKITFNGIWNDIIFFLLAVFGAIVYFTILYIFNHGEMRVYTLLSFITGILTGNKLINIFKKKAAE